jgi:hypothetical protein
MDGNSYPGIYFKFCTIIAKWRFNLIRKDLAVGSFMSGHALVFRSSPVIQLALTIRAENSLIDPDGGSVILRVCSSFESKFTIPQICIT